MLNKTVRLIKLFKMTDDLEYIKKQQNFRLVMTIKNS